MLKNDYLVIKIGVDSAENGPSKVVGREPEELQFYMRRVRQGDEESSNRTVGQRRRALRLRRRRGAGGLDRGLVRCGLGVTLGDLRRTILRASVEPR